MAIGALLSSSRPGAAVTTLSIQKSSPSCHISTLFNTRKKSCATAKSASTSPPSPPDSLSDVVWPSVGAFAAMAVMSQVDKRLQHKGLTFLIAPFGAVCCVLFATPNAPAARRYNVLMAHMGCALIGVLALAAFGPGWIARSVALAASVAYMEFTKCLHPPAAGLPLLFIDAPKFHHLQWWYILFPGAIGCILLLLLQEAVVFLKKNAKF